MIVESILQQYSELVKPVRTPRVYRSKLRAEHARRTREQVIDAARILFTTRGYAATTIRAVAEAAGVVPETVYDIFGTKRALLEAVVDSAITGGVTEPQDWLGHSWVTEILAVPSPRERLIGWIRHTAATLARTGPVHAVIRGAAESDRDLEDLNRRLQAERFAAHRRLIEPMTGRAATDEESETFSALTSPELHHVLTVTRGWTQQRYTTWLEQTVTALIPAGH